MGGAVARLYIEWAGVEEYVGNRLYWLNWFVCFYDCVLVPSPRAPRIAIGLTGTERTVLSCELLDTKVKTFSFTHLRIQIFSKKKFQIFVSTACTQSWNEFLIVISISEFFFRVQIIKIIVYFHTILNNVSYFNGMVMKLLERNLDSLDNKC